MNTKIRRTLTATLISMIFAATLIPSLPSATALAEEQDYVFVSLDNPEWYSTNAQGINANGDIVGCFAYPNSEWVFHGFLFSKGVFTVIDYPGATQTYARGISPSGDIVGFYYEPKIDANGNPVFDANGKPVYVNHGFMRTKEGEYIRIDYPGSLTNGLTRILPDGTVIGMNTSHPCIITKKNATEKADLGGSYFGATPNGKQLVGVYFTPAQRSFLIDNGAFFPFSVFDSTISAAWDISPDGNTIVGVYKHQSEYWEGHAYIAQRNGTNVNDWKFTDFVYPGATVTATRLFGMNANGDLVGAYNHADGVFHGFVAIHIDE